MRKNIICNVKYMNFTTNIISNKWLSEKVFINERLTKLRRALFDQTRATAKEKLYKFFWLFNADILVRKDKKLKIIKIILTKDIKNLL